MAIKTPITAIAKRLTLNLPIPIAKGNNAIMALKQSSISVLNALRLHRLAIAFIRTNKCLFKL
jgi:hypothetical protein